MRRGKEGLQGARESLRPFAGLNLWAGGAWKQRRAVRLLRPFGAWTSFVNQRGNVERVLRKGDWLAASAAAGCVQSTIAN